VCFNGLRFTVLVEFGHTVYLPFLIHICVDLSLLVHIFLGPMPGVLVFLFSQLAIVFFALLSCHVEPSVLTFHLFFCLCRDF
jgi:hypothetical protein